MGAMGAMVTMGTTVPMAIATPTITIRIPIIDVVTITIPMATGMGVMRGMRGTQEEAGVLQAAVSTAVDTAAAARAAATAVGTVDIIDLALASGGSPPAPRPLGFIWPMRLRTAAA